MSDEHSNDKRRYHRIFYRATATLNTGTETRECDIVDISLKGCLLRFAEPWQSNLEAPCYFKLNLSDTTTIIMHVTPTHCVGNQIGFKCEHIDIESISELRRLVELNLGNTELLERDMQSLSEVV